MPNRRPNLDRIFHGLSDGTRRAVVERLVLGPASVKQLAEPFDMSLPSVMQHLRVLEECDLIHSEKVGRVRTCHINAEVLRAAEAWLAGQRTTWEERLDLLDEVLGEGPATSSGRPPAAGPQGGRPRS